MEKVKLEINRNSLPIRKKDSFAFMGLSLGKKLFGDKKVMSYYSRFLSENFSKSFFLIADLPKKYNIMAIEGVTEEEALRRINHATKNFKKFLEKIIKDFPNISIKHYEELQDENYFNNLKVLNEAYLRDLTFRNLVRKSVSDFLGLPNNKKRIENSKLIFNEAIDIAVNYRLDELAILLSIPCKYDELYEVYPGIDPLHEMLCENQFEFCKNLNQNSGRKHLEVYHED